jgi:methyltransferase family protein
VPPVSRQDEFAGFVLAHLPRPPGRVLEVGCGEVGGVAPWLAEAGYEPLAIDPNAPDGPWYRRVRLEDLGDHGPFAAAVCGRVLHHLDPLEQALDRLAGLAPLLVLDEFAWNRIDDRARGWYRAQHRRLEDPPGPLDLAAWLPAHSHLHTFETMQQALDARYEPRFLEPGPYLYRWLGAGREEEERLIAAGELPAIGWRYVGTVISA